MYVLVADEMDHKSENYHDSNVSRLVFLTKKVNGIVSEQVL